MFVGNLLVFDISKAGSSELDNVFKLNHFVPAPTNGNYDKCAKVMDPRLCFLYVSLMVFLLTIANRQQTACRYPGGPTKMITLDK